MRDSGIDIARRRLLRGVMASAAGTMLPWDVLYAQNAGSELTIAYISDIPSWDPCLQTVPQAQSIYETVFDSPLRYSPTLQLQPRQITAWKWQDTHAQRLEVTLRDDIFFHDG